MSRCSIALVLSVLFAIPPLHAQTTARVSVGPGGVQGNRWSSCPSISADGRFVAFQSDATTFLQNDLNPGTDVFVRDRATGAFELVSVSSQGIQGDLDSSLPSISADGRYVAFQSQADNLVPGDTNGVGDVFVRDRVLGLTERVSVDSNGVESNNGGGSADISGDGRYVVFASIADNLVPADTNGLIDVFLRDRVLAKTTRVSVTTSGAQGDGNSQHPCISADGRYVAFESQAPAFGASTLHTQIYVHDDVSGALEMVSLDPSGIPSYGWNLRPSISGDGRWVAFTSEDSMQVPGPAQLHYDVQVRDRVLGRTTLASVSSGGILQNGLFASSPRISADGRSVIFLCDASNLVPGDTNARQDLFLRDLVASTTTRASVGDLGQEADDEAGVCAISGDGRFAAFMCWADNLVPGDTNQLPDVFLRDRGPVVTGTPYCFGDGSGTACPCGNTSPIGENAGCRNSLGVGGKLAASGMASIGADTVVLFGSDMPDSFALYFQGTQASAGFAFGDGLRCATGAMIRLGSELNAGGLSHYPSATDPPISVKGGVAQGNVRTYQCWYRNAAQFCQTETFNLTNGVQLAWGP